MNNRNLARNILLDIDKLKSGESLIIEGCTNSRNNNNSI